MDEREFRERLDEWIARVQTAEKHNAEMARQITRHSTSIQLMQQDLAFAKQSHREFVEEWRREKSDRDEWRISLSSDFKKLTGDLARRDQKTLGAIWVGVLTLIGSLIFWFITRH